MKIKPQTRSMTFERMGSIDEENRTIELSFSSEEPYERYFGIEILDHSAESVDLARLNGKAPVLVNHDPDQQVGVIETARIDGDRVGRAKIRFGKSERANEIWNDVKDGIRNLVSVGYRINEMQQEGKKDGVDIFRVNSWSPAEVSIVAVPADSTVGIGRNFENQTENDCEVKTMNEEVKPVEKQQEKAAPVVDIAKIQQEARQSEVIRSREIRAMGEQFNVPDLADKLIESGSSVEEMRGEVLEHLKKNGAVKVQNRQSSEVDLSKKEVVNYSLIRAINAFVAGNWKKAGLEREVSIAMADRAGKDPQGFFVPAAIFGRTLDSTTATTAAELVGTDHRGDMFIELLRNKSVVMEAGARAMSGLVGNVDIPKLSAGSSFTWIGEGADATLTDPTTATVSLTPKTIAGGAQMTRRLLLQSSPSVDRMVTDDLLAGLATAIDLAALAGAGGSAPTGILNTAGVGSVTLGAGLVTRDNIVDLETAVATDNADIGALRYVFNAVEKGIMKKTKTDAGSGIFLLDGDELNGYSYTCSNQLANDKIIFGNFNDLMLGFWSGIDIEPDKAALAASGGLVLRVFQDMDVAVRHAESFAVGAV